MALKKCESGVSPVIGTILLVAITVVLVAIIAAVVMGMSNGVSNTKSVGLTVTPIVVEKSHPGWSMKISGVNVLLTGGKDVSNLRKLTVFIEGAGDNEEGADAMYPMYDEQTGNRILGPISISNPVGAPLFYEPHYYNRAYQNPELENVLVIVKGTFDDGTEHILYQNRMTISEIGIGTMSSSTINEYFVTSPDFI